MNCRIIVCAALLVAVCESAFALSINLSFSALPTAQSTVVNGAADWTYGGPNPEENLFSFDGTKLVMDTRGTGIRPIQSGHGYSLHNVLSNALPFILTVHARIIEDEAFGSFGVSINTGGHSLPVFIQESGFVVSSGVGPVHIPHDNHSAIRRIRILGVPGGTASIFVDGERVSTQLQFRTDVMSNNLGFGDSTFDGNSLAELHRYSFRQGMGALTEFYATALADGSLHGIGNGNSGKGREKALGNMLQAAEDLIVAEQNMDACDQLSTIAGKIDGHASPPDFVAGVELAEFQEFVAAMRAALFCSP